jgi:hypothetical protein
MPTLHEWHFGDGAVQLVDDPARAGNGSLTLIVDDLGQTRADLEAQGLPLGPAMDGDVVRFAQISDPEGNLVTLVDARR